jgi:hypothetical protein
VIQAARNCNAVAIVDHKHAHVYKALMRYLLFALLLLLPTLARADDDYVGEKCSAKDKCGKGPGGDDSAMTGLIVACCPLE